MHKVTNHKRVVFVTIWGNFPLIYTHVFAIHLILVVYDFNFDK